MASYLDSILKKTAAATPLGGKYPFIPEGNHTLMRVKDLFILVGGNSGDTAILEVAIVESDNPKAVGKIFSAVNPLQGTNANVSFGNLQLIVSAVMASALGEDLEETPSEGDMVSSGVLGIKAGPSAPASLESSRSKAVGTPISSNSVRVLKKNQKAPMTEENSYVRHNWRPVFGKTEDNQPAK